MNIKILNKMVVSYPRLLKELASREMQVGSRCFRLSIRMNVRK
jgi:hypothetical protein